MDQIRFRFLVMLGSNHTSLWNLKFLKPDQNLKFFCLKSAGVLGALVGSAVGSKMGDAATRKPAIELLLDLDSGKTVSIIQEEGDYSFAVGQRVKIIKNKGKSRVMPLQ